MAKNGKHSKVKRVTIRGKKAWRIGKLTIIPNKKTDKLVRQVIFTTFDNRKS